ncbi:hypothetical protein ACFOWU_00230 [Epilithonimonas zeae]|uniref:Uncharacterized protein n=1 Tax=Epilithonimonas zeae TaxID=1416779 RepID=A0A1N6DU64_9FLAO|nr:hypothetical protein [Epilithonimonas zeae]SIN74234.1 hypothetical protein SAMN05444409_0048 [Epilithonimonas zeae]
MRKFILSIPAKAVTDTYTATITSSLTPINPYKINLTDDEKPGMRTMAEGREGYARLISRIATQFPDALGRSDSPEELAALLDYYGNLEGGRIAILQNLETFEEIQLGASADIMALTDRYKKPATLPRK